MVHMLERLMELLPVNKYVCTGHGIFVDRKIVLVSLVLAFSYNHVASASLFDDAQAAAQSGRYNDVISILTGAIESGELLSDELVVAYSNRGIAYSLLKAHAMAEADLMKAVEINSQHELALNHLGILAEHVHKDYETARLWYGRAADLGFPGSEVNLANLYLLGRGGAVDFTGALKLYELAAAEEYALAYVPIGVMYMDGLGVNRNYSAGVQWLKKGKSAGVIDANYHLGNAYEKGTGLTRDFRKAAELYHHAAMQGHGKAQNSLGYLYRQGLGVKQDFLEAVKWYRLAADQGVNKALNRLAWLLATCPTAAICSGESALELALVAVDQDDSPSNLDTLAAAYARAGEFEKATETLQRIVRNSNGNLSRYAGRLKLYEQGIPYQL
jgi:TPR repeat protein